MPASVRRLLPLALVVALAGPATGQPLPQDAASAERMKKDLFFLAGPDCEGRGVGTAGLDKAADHVAAQFKAAGLQPGGKDGTYFQPFTMSGFPTLAGDSSLAFAGPDGKTITPEADSEFGPTGYTFGGKHAAGVVFVGHGVAAPNLKYDDYAGVDVKGKWVVVVRKNPRPAETGDKRFDTAFPPDQSPYAGLVTKLSTAAAKKAAGVILVSDPTTAGANDPLIPFATDEHRYADPPARLPVLHLKRAVASKLLTAALGKSLEDLEAENDKELKPVSAELTGWTATADVGVSRKDVPVRNVVGVLPGSGPLADETVVIGAHYDHLGPYSYGSAIGRSGEGQTHYGADDNASGTTALMELARRFGGMKDRRGRRLVFVAFTGEERGLFGSKFYCENPLVPLDKTAAMVNLDMVGRLRPGPGDWLGITTKPQLQIWGTGTGDTFPRQVAAVEDRYGLRVKSVPAGTGPSDHDSFYRKGVPVLFLFTDFHSDYHRPSDTPDKIDLPGMLTVVGLTEDLAGDLAAGVARPKYQEVKEAQPRPRVVQGVRLGVKPDYTYQGGDGMRIEGVTAGGLGEKAGLKDGDVIAAIDGVPVGTVEGYMAALVGKKPGTAIEVVILRGGKKETVTVKP
ncbi:MAG: M28 family peptidase [Gemmataceae bacterium]|nr:M28 family peptidase [Gemmataceae bacterium]